MTHLLLPPTSILLQTDLIGNLDDVNEDPDNPENNWMVATGNNVDTILRVGFDTPSGNPTIGAGLQVFRAWVREFDPNQTGTTQGRLELWENGSLIREAFNVSITTTGQMLTMGWNANELSTPDGSLVECRFFGDASGGSPSSRQTVDIDAIDWSASVDAAPSFTPRSSGFIISGSF